MLATPCAGHRGGVHRNDRLPPRRECYVWWLRTREALPDDLLALVEADEAIWADVADEEQRSLLQWRRALTRLVVGFTLDVPAESVLLSRACDHCGETDHGRPTVPGESFSMSTAAADGIVAVAVGVDLQVGVDVVARDECETAVEFAPALCVPEDAEVLAGLDADARREAAMCAVAQLEAYTKASGVGWLHRTRDVVVSLDPARPAVSAAGRPWWARRIAPGPAYVAMLVADQRPRAVRTIDATSLLIDRAHLRATPA